MDSCGLATGSPPPGSPLSPGPCGAASSLSTVVERMLLAQEQQADDASSGVTIAHHEHLLLHQPDLLMVWPPCARTGHASTVEVHAALSVDTRAGGGSILPVACGMTMASGACLLPPLVGKLLAVRDDVVLGEEPLKLPGGRGSIRCVGAVKGAPLLQLLVLPQQPGTLDSLQHCRPAVCTPGVQGRDTR